MLSNVERLAQVTADRIKAEAKANEVQRRFSVAHEHRRTVRASANKAENLNLPGAVEAREAVNIADIVCETARKENNKARKDLRKALAKEHQYKHMLTAIEKSRIILDGFDASISNPASYLGASYDAVGNAVMFDMGFFQQNFLSGDKPSVHVSDVNKLDAFIASLTEMADKMRA